MGMPNMGVPNLFAKMWAKILGAKMRCPKVWPSIDLMPKYKCQERELAQTAKMWAM